MSALRDAAEAAAAYFAEQLARNPNMTRAAAIHDRLIAALNVRPYVPIVDLGPVAPEAVGKTCTRCWVRKSFKGFSRRLDRRDGYQTICKLCAKAYQARRQATQRESRLRASGASVARLRAKREGLSMGNDRASERRL